MGYIPPGIKPCLTQIKRVTICSAVLCAGWLCVWTSSAFLSSPPSPSSSSSCTAAFLLPTPVWPSPTPYRCAALTCCIWVGKLVGQDRYCAVINFHCLLLHSCYSLLVFFPFPHPANRPVSVHREAAFWNRSPFYISGADQSLHKGRSSCDTCVLVVSMANRKGRTVCYSIDTAHKRHQLFALHRRLSPAVSALHSEPATSRSAGFMARVYCQTEHHSVWHSLFQEALIKAEQYSCLSCRPSGGEHFTVINEANNGLAEFWSTKYPAYFAMQK